MSAPSEKEIPLLTDIVEETEPSDAEAAEMEELGGSTITDLETVIAEMQTRLASKTYALTDELMRAAFAELEANVFRQILSELRQQLPELIDAVIREHLISPDKDNDD